MTRPFTTLAAGLAAAVLSAACTTPAVRPPETADATPPPVVPSPTTEPIASLPPAPPTDAAEQRDVIPYEIVVRTNDAATADFTDTVDRVLTNPRGWIRAGFHFQRRRNAPFQIVLAEGRQVDALCKPLDTYGTYSCQNGPVVALNADRWRSATPKWTGDLLSYRVMLINHEVGHLLHLHHPVVHCPKRGLPAPVMAQQSTELGRCLPNPWPLQWEVDLAALRREPLAPPPQHETDDHRPTPPAVDR